MQRISKEEVKVAMKKGEWTYLWVRAVGALTRLFNIILESERMPEEWRRRVQHQFSRTLVICRAVVTKEG